MIPGEEAIRQILSSYRESFTSKDYNAENEDHDVMMDLFGVSPELKRENRQYWGRELGMCWQLLVTALFRATVKDFAPGYRQGADELCDLIAVGDAIDTKYRIGSGDSGTLKKFKTYGATLAQNGLNPVILIVRHDNLAAAMTACRVGGWTVNVGQQSFDYIEKATGVDFKDWLQSLGDSYKITRNQDI